MEKIVETVPFEKVRDYDIVSSYFGEKKVCMFDIETTGLSPFSSFTYIIGINVIDQGEWKIIQLFNDDGKSEPEMIRCFQDMIKDYDILMEFNGDRFDIPYIEKRMNFIQQKFGISLTDNFPHIQSFDLMRCIKPYRFALGLPNIKQKTIEKYLGINRLDMYNGGQLIDVYLGYLAMQDDHSRQLVLRHNRDDMEGMIFLSNILSIESMAEGRFEVESFAIDQKGDKLYLVIRLLLENELKPVINTGMNGSSLKATGKNVELRVPLLSGSLNFFLGNSVKDGCETYEGYYAPLYAKEIDGIAVYKKEIRSKESYVMLDDTFLGNKEHIRKYAKSMIEVMLTYKGK